MLNNTQQTTQVDVPVTIPLSVQSNAFIMIFKYTIVSSFGL